MHFLFDCVGISQLCFACQVCCLRDTAFCYLLLVATGNRQFDVGCLFRNVLSTCHCDVRDTAIFFKIDCSILQSSFRCGISFPAWDVGFFKFIVCRIVYFILFACIGSVGSRKFFPHHPFEYGLASVA